MRQRGQVDPVEPDPLEPLLPRLGEPVPGLGAVPDDGEAPGRAAAAAASATRRRSAPAPRPRRRARTGRRAGPGRRRAVRPRRPGRLRRSSPRSIDITSISESSVAIRSSTTLAICSRSAATAASCRRLRRDASGSPSRCRAASSSGRSDTVQACGVRALQPPHLVGAEPGRAPAQVGGHRPQVADEVGRLEQRPRPVEGRRAAPGSARSDRRSRSAGTSAVVLVDQDREQLLPDLVARLVVRRAGLRRLERLGPVVGAQPDVGPRRSRPSMPSVGGSS